MCAPMALAVASMVASGVGAMQASESRKSAANYNAAVAEQNARVAGWQAEDAQNRATDNAMRVGRQQADMRGKQKAALAANGLDLGSGSPQAVLDQTDYYGLEDQRTALQNGETEAWGLRTKQSQYKTEGQWQRNSASAENPMMSGMLGMLGSAGNVADKWGRSRGTPSERAGS